MRFAVLGVGAVGSRAARQLLATEGVRSLRLFDPDPAAVEATRSALADDRVSAPADAAQAADGAEVVVLAGPVGTHLDAAAEALAAGRHVVSVSDANEDVRALLALDASARRAGTTVAVGAGFAPGLTCLLAAHLVAGLDEVDELHVAKVGTAGPACARQHHRALRSMAVDWRDGQWHERPGGSGRELCWFPDPVGPRDCYRAALPDALLLQPAFPSASRVTARMAATRRDRLTSPLPMLRKPHPEGGPGAVRVEARGRRGSSRVVQVYGAMDRPGLAAGAVAAITAVALARGQARRTGAGGLAEVLDPLESLRELAHRGVKAAVFEGVV